MIVWPYIVAFIALIAVASRSMVAVSVLAAYLLSQFLPSDLLLKFFLWQLVGTFIMFKLREQLPGALVIASGLCYPAAKFFGAEIAVGSLPFVLSDIAAVSAVLIGSYGGLVSRLDGKRYMGWADNRRHNCYSYRNTRVEEES